MESGQNNYYNNAGNNMGNNMDNNLGNMQDECKRCMNFHITIRMKDGNTFDGIIESVENDHINMMVGEDVMEGEVENQPMGQMLRRPRRRYRRFRRRRFPLGALAALSLIPYPYFAPPYPYHYYPY